MAQRCRTCNHPDRDRIEQALANTRSKIAGGVEAIAQKWGIPRSSLQRHLSRHMTQEQVARLRHGMPDNIEVSIEEITRQEGEGAILGLKRLRLELQIIAERADKAGDFQSGIRARQAQLKIYEEQAKLAAMYPGRKQVTNNNLVLGDVTVLFDMIDKVLLPFPEARRAVAQAFSQQAPALEYAA